MTVGAVVVALMASLPAMAAEHGTTKRSETTHAGDPFASYNTELNDAASNGLRDVETHAVPATESPRPPELSDAQVRAREHGSKLGRERVERLLPVIAPILRKAGVPVALAGVVLVESGGNPSALSPKGARGLWQLMPDTAREYGLIVNGETDQRLSVVKSTRAAAEYLRDLYAEFGNWRLALAAYNTGDKTVHRAMARTGGNGFATASIALPAETQSYVPKVMRALGWFGGPVLPGPKKESRLQQVAYAVGD
jgi:membrane-bound lytic murein transglycosylase D